MAMDSEVDQASFQQLVQAENQGLEIEPINQIRQNFYNLKQLKSYEILMSAWTIFTTNFKVTFLMILSAVPLFAFIIFFEIKLQNTIQGFPKILDKPGTMTYFSSSGKILNWDDQQDDFVDLRKNFIYNLLHVCIFYLVLHPMLEIVSAVISVKFAAARVQPGDTQVSLKDALYNNNFKVVFLTYLCVHLLSALTLTGLIWVILNNHLFCAGIRNPYKTNLSILSVGFHTAVFIALLYTYLFWSAFWNMSIVISVLEETTGFGPFGLSEYYGKHCKKTGFQLMLVFFAFGNILRVPALFFGLCKLSYAGVFVTAIAVGLVCMVNLVKWVAFVLYFYDCKQQVMEKKGDEEAAKSVKKDEADAC